MNHAVFPAGRSRSSTGSYPRLAAAVLLWGPSFIIPGGGVRPGVRSPEVWALRYPTTAGAGPH